jgi:hypothetical protein
MECVFSLYSSVDDIGSRVLVVMEADLVQDFKGIHLLLAIYGVKHHSSVSGWVYPIRCS